MQYLNLLLAKRDYGMIRNVQDIDALFVVPTEREAYEYIKEHWQKYGQVPDKETVLRKCSDFELYEVEDSPDALLHDMREQRLSVELAPVIRKAAELYQSDSAESVKYLQNEIVRLARMVSSDISLYDYTKSAGVRLEDYKMRANTKGLVGISTGLPSLDNDTNGWRKGHLNILGGRLNEGKTWLGLFFAATAWLAGENVAFWSLESSKDEIAYRLDSIIAHFSNMALFSGKLSEKEFQRWMQFIEEMKNDKPLYILTNKENGGNRWTADGIARVVEQEKLGLVTVDQASLMDDGKGKRTIRERYIEVATDSKLRAEDTQTPWILLAQVNRDGAKASRGKDEGTPGMEHLAESDALGQFADVGLVAMQIPPLMKLSLKKQRFGPKDVDYILSWNVDKGEIKEVGNYGDGEDQF